MGRELSFHPAILFYRENPDGYEYGGEDE